MEERLYERVTPIMRSFAFPAFWADCRSAKTRSASKLSIMKKARTARTAPNTFG